MWKKLVWVAPVLALLLMGADRNRSHRPIPEAAGYTGPNELLVINKSGMPIEMTLTGQDTDSFYVLRVPTGDQAAPTQQIFEVAQDTYTSSVWFVEIYDPTYGYTCSSKSMEMPIYRNVRVTVIACDKSPRGRSEPPSILKYGTSSGRGR
jgi:hypothetical protein